MYLLGLGEITVIFLAIGILIITVVSLIIKASIKEQTKEIIKELNEIGTLTVTESNAYHYDFLVNGITYKLKLLYIGNYKELSINSKTHWQVKPSKKIKLIPVNGFDALPEPKMLIVYPHPGKMVKYINENEIVFIRPLEKCFDFYLFTNKELNKIREI
ncbi:MAG: hypothetical protein ACOX02_03190 [Acholeplasmatales bacterium]